MGAKEPDPFNILRRPKASAPPEPDPFNILRKSEGRRESPFQVFRHSPRPEPPPPPNPERPAPTPRKGFFDWLDIFRKKPKVEVEPIPAAERRRTAEAAPGLPGPQIERPAEPPVPSAPPGPPPPTVVIEAPAPSAPGALVVALAEPPADLFSIIAPPMSAPPPPPVRGGLIVAEPQLPTAAVPAPDVFEILAPPPAAPPPAGGLVVRETDLPAVAEPLDAFNMIVAPAEEAPGGLVPSAPQGPFEILAPESSPFDILVPEAQGGGIVPAAAPGEMSVFDVLDKPSGGAVAPYDTRALDPFSMISPEPGAAAPPPPGWGGWGGYAAPAPPAAAAAEEEEEEEEEPRKKKPKRKPKTPTPPKWIKRGNKWVYPSVDGMARWFKESWNLQGLWDTIREMRTDPEFQEAVAEEDWDGAIPLETIAYASPDEYEQVARYFDMPTEAILPMVEKIHEKYDKQEEPYEEEEELHEFLQGFYQESVTPALDKLMPKDIPEIGRASCRERV